MGSKADEFRRRLPQLTDELNDRLKKAIEGIELARNASANDARHRDDVGQAYRKGLTDALTLLRPVNDTRESFESAALEAAGEMQAAERTALFK